MEIKRANALSKLDVVSFDRFSISFHVKLSKVEYGCICQILVDNMMSMCQKIGEWEPKDKQGDLKADWMRYLIVKDGSNIVGYCAFRFDLDEDRKVVYVYELQVSSKYQGFGIGAALLNKVDTLGRLFKLELIVLTSLKVNTGANKFYLRNK